MSLRATAFLLFTLACVIISPNSLRAEDYRPIIPPEFHKQSLLNGMEILLLTGNDQRVPFVLMIKNGVAFDPIEKWGVTYLTSWMILEQSETSNGLAVETELRELEAELDLRVEWDAIFFVGSAPSENLVDVLNLLAEMVVRPAFREETFQQLRNGVLQELEERPNQLESLTQDVFLAELFQANPYAHSVKGTTETLKNLSLADVKTQYRKLFLPNQSQLAFFSPGDPDGTVAALSRHWGSWIKNDPLPFTFRKALPPNGRRVQFLDQASADSLFRWGNLSVERSSADYYALKVFQQYLTLSLPSWASQIASQRQIQASSELESRRMPGYLQLSIQAPPEELIAYFHRFESFAQDLHDGHIDSQKFEEAKQLAYLEMIDSLREPLAGLYRLLETSLYEVGINFLTNYGLRLDRLTRDDFQEAVQKYVALDNFVLVVAGPSQHLQSELDKIGAVEPSR